MLSFIVETLLYSALYVFPSFLLLEMFHKYLVSPWQKLNYYYFYLVNFLLNLFENFFLAAATFPFFTFLAQINFIILLKSEVQF